LADLNIGFLVLSFLVLLFSLTVHESAHAWTADRLGDPTARQLGRISMNPVVHVDLIGTIVLPLVAISTGAPIIGWAKPVPVNVHNLRRPRQDFMRVALAGPVSNALLAIGSAAVLAAVPASAGEGPSFVRSLAATGFQLNLLLAVFNMVPVPPLDGGTVLAGLLPESLAGAFDRVRPYGFMILYVLLLTGTLNAILFPPLVFLSRLLRP
jgi:Zn-dependent protease